jgi:hypothetical protein
LPQDDEIPDLGLDGQSLLVVYSKTIYRVKDQELTLIHSGDILLPRSELPPQLHGNMVFLRDDGWAGSWKRLWWLTLGEHLQLSTLDHDVGVVGPKGPRWESCSSYCVTRNGDLWACVDRGDSLVRRSKDGRYSVAIMNGSVRFTEDQALIDPRGTDRGLSVYSVAPLPDDTLLLAGRTGLYRLRGDELVQELAFTFAETVDSSGRVERHWRNPGSILPLNDKSYLIGYDHGGVYLLRKGDDGQWSFQSLDEKLGDPVVW